jgi:hypothetical protein
MADTLFVSSKLRHVFPIADIVRRDITRDADCSAILQVPYDGEVIIVDGAVASSPTPFAYKVAAGVAFTQAQFALANRCKMIWGSHKRTDRQANNQERVAYLMCREDMEIELGMFLAESAVNLDTQFAAGTPITFVEDANKRIVACPVNTALAAITATDTVFVFGEVIETPSKSAVPANDDTIKIRLYAHARTLLVGA